MRREGSGEGAVETGLRYGPFGQVREYRGALNTLTLTRDDWGRVIAMSDEDLGATSYSYDSFDRVISMTDADGSTATYFYDPLDRLTAALHDDGSSERYFFDRDLAAEAEGEAPTTNSLGRLVRSERLTSSFDHFKETFRYEAEVADPLHNRALLQSIKLQTPEQALQTHYEYYDNSSRVLLHHYPSAAGAAPFGVQYCYDGTGAMTHAYPLDIAVSCTDTTATETDAYWHRTSTKNGIGQDGFALGNGVDVTLDLDPVTYRLNGHQAVGASSTIGYQYEYEPGGRLHARTNTRTDVTQGFSYSETGVLEKVCGGPCDEAIEYSYEASFNAASQLESSTLGTFHYAESDDGVVLGNRVTSVESATSPGALNEFSYDARGNQELRTGPDIAGGYQALTYNHFNLPDSIITGEGPDASQVHFDYNAEGQRIKTSKETSTTWHFGEIFERETREDDPDIAEEERYFVFVQGNRTAQVTRSRPGGATEWSETVQYFLQDRLGSTIALSDAAGDMTAELDYGVYGEPLQPMPTPYGYTGHRHETELGLVDAGGRFYDPKFGFFLSPDPLSPLSGGSPRMNRYAYVGYDPINFTDPTGFQPAWYDYGTAAANWITFGGWDPKWEKDDFYRVYIGFATVVVSIAAPPAGASIIFAGVGATQALAQGASAGQVLESAFVSSTIGVVSSSLGAVAGAGVTQAGASPLTTALAIIGASTGANIGLQTVAGREIDWALVAAQTTHAIANAGYDVYRASQREERLEGLYREGRGDAKFAERGAAHPPDACKGLCPTAGFELVGDKSTIAGAEYSIGRAIHEGALKRAGRIALRAIGAGPTEDVFIDLSDDETGRVAYTQFRLDRGKEVSRITFHPGSMTSGRDLLSWTAHEIVHLQQGRNYYWGADGTQLNFLNEVEAYQVQLSSAATLGLNAEMVTNLQGLWYDYYQKLGPEYQGYAQTGNLSP